MQREHEEAMREDFARYVDLADQVDKGLTLPGPFGEQELLAIDAQQEELRERWRSGPHAEHWNYLEDAREDWRAYPDTMSRMHDNVAHNGGGGLSDIQLRSLDQAAELTAQSNERHAGWLREARSQMPVKNSRRGRSGAERSR